MQANHLFHALTASILAFGLSASADVITLGQGTHSLEGVTIAQTATGTVAGKALNLTAVGAGLRIKTEFVITAKVYVGTLFVTQPAQFVRTAKGALASVGQMNAAAMRMDFVREVGVNRIVSSFRDGFSANDVDTDNPAISQFLAAVQAGGDIANGKALTVVGVRLSPTVESVTFENASSGKVATIQGPQGFVRSVFSLWIGQGADAGVTKLKEQILRGF